MIDLTKRSWHTPRRIAENRAIVDEAKAIRMHIEKSAHIVRAFLSLNGFDPQEMARMTDPARWHVQRARFWAGQSSMFDRDGTKRDELLGRLAGQSWLDPGVFALAAERVILSGGNVTSGAVIRELREIAASGRNQP